MKYELLKRSHIKRNIIVAVIVVFILSAIILTFTRAKYKTTESIPLLNGTINYTLADLNVVAMYVNGEQVDALPNGNFVLTSESYCTNEDGEKDESITISYDSATQGLSVSPLTKKGTKCYLYFNKVPSSNIQLLATVNGESSNTFPTKDSNYTPDSISCTNDATAKFDFTDWAVEVDSVDSTTCTVNFKDNINETFANYLIGKECSSTPTSDDDAKNCLVNENGYRYEGKNPNNYVLFNDELWRVIGVFSMKTASGNTENLVKLIRSETLDGLAWDGTNINDWSSATLQQQLNNGYLNATDSTCNFVSSNTKTCYFSETGLNSTSRGMIESVVWNLGGYSTYSATADRFYTAERGTRVHSGRPTTWTGKVGLMYPSDYGYAVLASSCARTTNLGDYDSTACAGNNWLKSDAAQWTLTPDASVYEDAVFNVDHYGDLSLFTANTGNGARPSIYLKSSIVVLGGDGSRYFPYIIK